MISHFNPSTVVPFAGLISDLSDLPIFEIDGDPKSALRFVELALFGVFVLGVNPSNLTSLAPIASQVNSSLNPPPQPTSQRHLLSSQPAG